MSYYGGSTVTELVVSAFERWKRRITISLTPSATWEDLVSKKKCRLECAPVLQVLPNTPKIWVQTQANTYRLTKSPPPPTGLTV